MGENSARQQVLDCIDALNCGDLERALEHYADDVDFLGYAPVEIFPHLGHRRGKAEFAETLRTRHASYAQMKRDVEFIAADGDTVATILSIQMQKRGYDRILKTHVADFYRLRDGLIVEQRQFLDSFDAVEQVLERDITELIKRARPLP